MLYSIPMSTTYTQLSTPLGTLLVTATSAAVTGIYFPTRDRKPKDRTGWTEDDGTGPPSALLARVRQQLSEYFAGSRRRSTAMRNGRRSPPSPTCSSARSPS